MMYLLTFDNDADFIPSLPEVTLWENFDEAMVAAIEEVMSAANGESIIEYDEINIDNEKGMFFIGGFCEIFPISVSSLDKITWFGKEFNGSED